MSIQFYNPNASYLNRYNRMPLGSIAREVNQIFNDLLYSDEQQTASVRTPNFKVKYNEQDVIVIAEVPGIDKDELQLSLKENVLTIATAKNVDENSEQKDQKEQTDEFNYAYKVAVQIETEVDEKKLSASLKNGILVVTLPKKEEEKTKEIAIQVQ